MGRLEKAQASAFDTCDHSVCCDLYPASPGQFAALSGRQLVVIAACCWCWLCPDDALLLTVAGAVAPVRFPLRQGLHTLQSCFLHSLWDNKTNYFDHRPFEYKVTLGVTVQRKGWGTQAVFSLCVWAVWVSLMTSRQWAWNTLTATPCEPVPLLHFQLKYLQTESTAKSKILYQKSWLLFLIQAVFSKPQDNGFTLQNTKINFNCGDKSMDKLPTSFFVTRAHRLCVATRALTLCCTDWNAASSASFDRASYPCWETWRQW